MTGKGHRATGVGAGFLAATLTYLLGFNPLAQWAAAVAAVFSTRLPDQLEIPVYKRGQRSTLLPHRTVTHWPYLWLVAMYLAWWYLETLPSALVIGASVGALLHILTDAPNPMGIPWFLPHRPVSLMGGLWRSGEREKTLIVLINGGALLFWLHAHGYLNWVAPVMRQFMNAF